MSANGKEFSVRDAITIDAIEINLLILIGKSTILLPKRTQLTVISTTSLSVGNPFSFAAAK
eukprot:CAMPEP_0194451134 /NCGR_PEP_ID=MMETSP0176-20130528/131135_1 /TAXON_ID=216777 /ORGANISM="Proboscia alata, Strain PI-D3" /LENGTH=60 /DNA_ID=CAMNT_0039278545 /DNA_START=871 /DNA_END=1053 /DNA_ORIENTATION=+